MNMNVKTNKEFRDICLTVGSIGLVTISILFIFSMFTILKTGKITLIILGVSLLLITIGMSKKNRERFKSLFLTHFHPSVS